MYVIADPCHKHNWVLCAFFWGSQSLLSEAATQRIHYMLELQFLASHSVTPLAREFGWPFHPIQLIYSVENDGESMWIALPPIPHQTVTTVRTTQSWFTRVINSCMSTSLLTNVIAWDGVSADGLRVAAYFNSKMTFWGSDRNRMVTLPSQTAEYIAIQQVWLKGWCSDDRRHQYAQW